MIRDPVGAGQIPRGLDPSLEARQRDRQGGARAVTDGFESLLLKRLVTAMRKTVPDSGLLASGPGGQMYDHLIEQALADHLARGDALGLDDLFAGATGAEPDSEPGTTPTRPSFRARLPEPDTLGGESSPARAPLASTLPPQEDRWLDSPGAEIELRRLLLEGIEPEGDGGD
ncbi:MAG: rod-binding protein [Myxococcota bacterium]